MRRGLAGLAVALGPLVGGIVTEGLDWHWIFWLNVPIGIVATVLAPRLLPESHGASERLDLVGVGLVTAGAVALVWALTRANDVGWSSAETVITFAVGGVLLVAFLAWENRVSEPMVPLRLFAVREFAIGNLTTYLMTKGRSTPRAMRSSGSNAHASRRWATSRRPSRSRERTSCARARTRT